MSENNEDEEDWGKLANDALASASQARAKQRDLHLLDDRLPLPGESCAVALPGAAKRAALAYDKIFFPTGPLSGLADFTNIPPLNLTFGTREDTEEFAYNLTKYLLYPIDFWAAPDVAEAYTYFCLVQKYEERGHVTIPYLHNAVTVTSGKVDSRSLLFQAVVDKIPVVSDETGWDEILAFREKPEALKNYRDLRTWIASVATVTSAQHATDLVSLRLERYLESIKEFGLKTTVGVIRHLYAGMASGGAVAMISEPIYGLLTAGILAGKFALWVADQQIAYKHLKRTDPNREVAVLIDIQKRFGG